LISFVTAKGRPGREGNTLPLIHRKPGQVTLIEELDIDLLN